ncbi:hypothetical protein ACIA5D_21595 [Actinoplanes sp. NPDC051513]|uniref:hypothetical protein n=1 Tax=Actinoplanes sp. NPDC051513 TaxID=3363908 RepID=UPI0037AAFBCD
MTRIVTLVLVDPAGKLLGPLPPFEAPTPWRQEVGDFADERWQVLRMLHADGREVTYLAETADPPAGLLPVDVDLAPHPRRAPYTEVGGPAASRGRDLRRLPGRHRALRMALSRRRCPGLPVRGRRHLYR